MRRLQKFLRLSGDDRVLLFKAIFLVAGVRLGLWLLPFRIVRRLTYQLSNSGASSECAAPVLMDRRIWAVKIASRFVPAATCLVQALAANVLLARSGCSCEVRIGVAKDAYGQLEAHAWVESNGRVVLGNLPTLSRYHLLPSVDAHHFKHDQGV